MSRKRKFLTVSDQAAGLSRNDQACYVDTLRHVKRISGGEITNKTKKFALEVLDFRAKKNRRKKN